MYVLPSKQYVGMIRHEAFLGSIGRDAGGSSHDSSRGADSNEQMFLQSERHFQEQAELRVPKAVRYPEVDDGPHL